MCGWFDLGDFNHFDLLHFSIFTLCLRPNGSGKKELDRVNAVQKSAFYFYFMK